MNKIRARLLIAFFILALLTISIIIACAPPVIEEASRDVGMRALAPGGDLEPGVYYAYNEAATADVLMGGIIDIGWDQIEATQDSISWTALDALVANVPTDKKGIIRVVLRDTNLETGVEVQTPSWAVASAFNPILVDLPSSCTTPGVTARLNYLDPDIQDEIEELHIAIASRYDGNAKVGGFEVPAGAWFEVDPYIDSSYYCGFSEEKTAYENAYTGQTDDFATYINRMVDAYIDNTSSSEIFVTQAGSFAENNRTDFINHAISNTVGIVQTDLRPSWNINRSLWSSQPDPYFCGWGHIFDPTLTYTYTTEMNRAYRTFWAATEMNSDDAPMSGELRGYTSEEAARYTASGYTWGTVVNALDKGFDIIEVYTDQLDYPDALSYFNAYAGKTASTTHDVWWIAHSYTQDSSFCPDIYNYNWHLKDNAEGAYPYYENTTAQNLAESIEARSHQESHGPSGDWRSQFVRKLSDAWPEMAFDIDNAYVYSTTAADAIIEVTYYNDGTDDILVSYDSDSGQTNLTITKTDTDTWETETFDSISDGHFADGLDVSGWDADILISAYEAGSIEYIHSVRVWVDDSTSSTPTPHSFVTATPTTYAGTPTATSVATTSATRTPVYTPTPTATPFQTLTINEVMVNADADYYGDTQYVELYCSTGTCDVSNYKLTVNDIYVFDFPSPVEIETEISNDLFKPVFAFLALSVEDLKQRCECGFTITDGDNVKLYDADDVLVDQLMIGDR